LTNLSALCCSIKGGVLVNVPRAERYAIHKLIVATERKDQTKAFKDAMQAGALIEALGSQRPNELAEAFAAAWQEGTVQLFANFASAGSDLNLLVKSLISLTPPRSPKMQP
jgi:hypothetical protein